MIVLMMISLTKENGLVIRLTRCESFKTQSFCFFRVAFYQLTSRKNRLLNYCQVSRENLRTFCILRVVQLSFRLIRIMGEGIGKVMLIFFLINHNHFFFLSHWWKISVGARRKQAVMTNRDNSPLRLRDGIWSSRRISSIVIKYFQYKVLPLRSGMVPEVRQNEWQYVK